MIFAKIFVAATCRKKSHLTEFVRLVAATEKIFTKNSPVHTKALVPAMRRRNCSPDLHTKSDLSRWRVAATHHLVCFDLFALLVIRAPEIFYSRFPTTWQGGHVGGQYNKQFFEELTWKTVYGSQMTAVTSRAKKSNTILKVKWNQFLRGDKSYLWGRQFCKEI